MIFYFQLQKSTKKIKKYINIQASMMILLVLGSIWKQQKRF